MWALEKLERPYKCLRKALLFGSRFQQTHCSLFLKKVLHATHCYDLRMHMSSINSPFSLTPQSHQPGRSDVQLDIQPRYFYIRLSFLSIQTKTSLAVATLAICTHVSLFVAQIHREVTSFYTFTFLKFVFCFGLAWCDELLPHVAVHLAAAFFFSEDRDAQPPKQGLVRPSSTIPHPSYLSGMIVKNVSQLPYKLVQWFGIIRIPSIAKFPGKPAEQFGTLNPKSAVPGGLQTRCCTPYQAW